MTPTRFRLTGSESKPRSRSGAERWKKLNAWDWMTCPQCMISRSFAAVGGMRTLMMASQALAEVSRWLIGQMPQMRAVIDGIS